MKACIKGIIEFLVLIATLAVTAPISQAQKASTPKRLEMSLAMGSEAIIGDTLTAPGRDDAFNKVAFAIPSMKSCTLDVTANGVTTSDISVATTKGRIEHIGTDHPWYPKSDVPTKLVYKCKNDAGESFTRTFYLQAHK